MQITGAFLAEHAEIVDQKLNVTGAVFDRMDVPPKGITNDEGQTLRRACCIVTLMQAGPDDHQKPYRLTTELVDSEGARSTLADGDVAFDAHTGENRFWVTWFGIAAEHGGRVAIIQTINGGESIAIPVELRVVDG